MAFRPQPNQGQTGRLRLVEHPQYGPRLGLRSPYSQMLVDLIKQDVPHGCRRWDGDLKGWFFDPSPNTLEVVRQILVRCGMKVVENDTTIFPECGDPGQAPAPWKPKGRPRPVPGAAPAGPAAGSAPPRAGAAAEDDRFFSRKYATTEDWAALYLLEGAPLPVAKAAYRALMGMSHPDQGGSAVDAQRVNVAWQRIEQQLAEES